MLLAQDMLTHVLLKSDQGVTYAHCDYHLAMSR